MLSNTHQYDSKRAAFPSLPAQLAALSFVPFVIFQKRVSPKMGTLACLDPLVRVWAGEANSHRELEVPLMVPSLLETVCPRPRYFLALVSCYEKLLLGFHHLGSNIPLHRLGT